ncbi:MAG: hypothetical protein ACI9SF_000661 [Candidatus Nanohaloarchaea archaeon]|jgi:hypothetical protein
MVNKNGAEDLVYSTVPDNVRAASQFPEEFEPGKAAEYFQDQEYNIAVLGTPEEDKFFDRLGFLLEDTELTGNIYSKPEHASTIIEDDRLDVAEDMVEAYEYQEEPSRRADLEAINEIHDPDSNLLLATWSYNVPRTNQEAERALDLEGVSDGYFLEFEDFDSMDVSSGFMTTAWIKGALYTLADSIPETAPVTSKIADSFPQHLDSEGESFNYEMGRNRHPEYVTAGVPWSDDIEEINKRHSMELFKNNIAPGWQDAKDGLKKAGRLLSDDFDY